MYFSLCWNIPYSRRIVGLFHCHLYIFRRLWYFILPSFIWSHVWMICAYYFHSLFHFDLITKIVSMATSNLFHKQPHFSIWCISKSHFINRITTLAFQFLGTLPIRRMTLCGCYCDIQIPHPQQKQSKGYYREKETWELLIETECRGSCVQPLILSSTPSMILVTNI